MQYLSESQKQNDLGSFLRQAIQHQSNPNLCPTTNAKEAEVKWFYEDLDVFFTMRVWNAKVESQEIPGITGKFGPGVQNKAVQRLSFAKRTHW